MTEKLYLCITTDEFELPIFISDSLKEMADFLGITKSGVCQSIKHCRNTKIGKGRCKIIKITA